MFRPFLLLIFFLFFSETRALTPDDLSLETKVGQLFIGCLHGETLSPESKQFLKESKLGNIIYFSWANGLKKKLQVKNLSHQIKESITTHAGIPPLIAIDQEGGRIERLQGEFSHFPGNGALGKKGDLQAAYETAAAMAKEMASVGINLNLAPVVDVDNNPLNPVINTRSFGNTPEKVTAFGKQMLDGFHRGGVLTTLKHFPGHGDVTVDSHHCGPIIKKSRLELEGTELAPFFALHQSTDAIMTAHLHLPALDPDHPATLSKIILQDLLREKWGFKGVVISDSLAMRGISEKQSDFEEALGCVSRKAVEAFLAGCDMMIISRLEWADFIPTEAQDLELISKVMRYFHERVLDGTIPMDRLNASVERVLAMKASLLL